MFFIHGLQCATTGGYPCLPIGCCIFNSNEATILAETSIACTEIRNLIWGMLPWISWMGNALLYRHGSMFNPRYPIGCIFLVCLFTHTFLTSFPYSLPPSSAA